MSRKKSNHEENGVAVEQPPTPALDAAEAPQSEEEKVQPAHAVRLKNVRAAIWANRVEGKVFFNVTFSRSYRDQDGNWHTTESFVRDDLLLLAKVADLAHSWIWEEIQASSNGPETPF